MRRLIDFDRPVAVLMVTILHFITSGEGPAVAAFRDALPCGGRLALTHATNQDRRHRRRREAALPLQGRSCVTARSHAEILALFEGLDLVEPGLVPVPLCPCALCPCGAPAAGTRSRTTRPSTGSTRESAASVREPDGHAPAGRRAHP
ncbi:SAM-dependent methyltransferase [Streptomyces glomeratus]|uniref:O-methyltransferase domain-containing protein n=1 Tax=Streptomyces glomeratus TaxID=284452 RepID=A0ABP6LV21_9ACTN|nr:SAM-dependent methyltransferase [Streptomyces glomeratus]MCF1510174.1 SAM-dependent methyltransferase [Streptomyces glomeratus]